MAGASKLPALSDAQWEIMNLIWDRESCTVSDIWKILNQRRGVSRNTVQTLIVRLEEKGWLSHREEESSFVYVPTVSREESQQATVARFIQTVFDGSPEGLVLTLLQDKTVSKSEAERIRKLLKSHGKEKS
ncbi:BlaI/MecI/CopY family transcriptional regulator [Blastopirellula sp. JC732]|uniref:BlaI/MecI/CopY family transcriptional regulator n=1 Tax=Blastopirellula sediminis TaxID=2894196 RepID=A0A9X1MP90_9BACT|nr:BlaI/MecI/CopY family transcriptional regulator [Blastopirellula sediminis]MCC9606306.1 BlaI/MecI/CopY family transcriptional regulator [Blastopirellula sediminis]MCC9630396.1 BlaI/MecI/CopY family transcriptional regulator [Blastopirellula sediminis]